MGICRQADLAVKTPYDPEADIEWLSGCGNRIQNGNRECFIWFIRMTDINHAATRKNRTSYRKVVVKNKK